jgi:hypothetical protein
MRLGGETEGVGGQRSHLLHDIKHTLIYRKIMHTIAAVLRWRECDLSV